MKSLFKKSLVLGIFCILGYVGMQAQQKSSFKVNGPCAACGSARIIGLVKAIDGVNVATFDAASSMLSVEFNPVAASLIDIQLELSVNGYDAGDFSHDANFKLPACASDGMRSEQVVENSDLPATDDIDELERDTDWENPASFELVGTSGDDDIDILDEEPENDDDLSSFADDKNGDSFGLDEDEADDTDE